jgi:lysophospholipase L1-like esterase
VDSFVYDADALTYFSAVTAAGSSVSRTARRAVSTLFTGLKTASLFTKIKRMNLFCTSTFAGLVVPAVNAAGSAQETFYGFTSANYSPASGLIGDGTEKYIATGLVPSTSLGIANYGLHAYFTESWAISEECAIGAFNGAGDRLDWNFTEGSFSTEMFSYLQAGDTGYIRGISRRDARGMHSAVNGGSGVMMYRHGYGLKTAVETHAGTLPAIGLYVMARNVLTFLGDQCVEGRIAFYAITDGMTAAQVATFSDLIQQFQVRMGRAYYPEETEISAFGDSLGGYSSVNLSPLAYADGRDVCRNLGIPAQTSTQIKDRFVADPKSGDGVVVIWAGTNNSWETSTVLADVATMVAGVTSGQYLVLMPLALDQANLWIGGGVRAAFEATRSGLLAAYGTKFIDVQQALVDAYDPMDAQDVIDYGHGITPSSFRTDEVHLNNDGNQLVADLVYGVITAKGW